MFIISDKLIINCDNVTNISYHYLDGKYKVIAFYGYDNWNCIIEVDTEGQAQKIIREIAYSLNQKVFSLDTKTLINSVCNGLSNDELMRLFRSKSKKVPR